MAINLHQVHHAAYQKDLPFWFSVVAGKDPILEIGSGYGRVTLPLLERGFQVVGVERDPAASEIIRDTLEKQPDELQNRVTLVEKDILEFQTGQSFGAVIIPCNTLTTFQPQQRQTLYSLAADLLDEGGLLAASLPNPVTMLKILRDPANQQHDQEPELEGSFIHPITGFPVQVGSRIAVIQNAVKWEWIYDHLHPDGRVERQVVGVKHYPAPLSEFTDQLMGTGFTRVRCLGNFYGDKYQTDSSELILVAVK